MIIPPALWSRYRGNPQAMDEEVRKAMNIPENRYYTVSMWPDHLAGNVHINKSMTRVVHAKKISKSDQHE